MRHATLLVALGFVTASQAQTTLFSESFEGSPAFTLNTTDAASVVGTWNTWVINNSYTGGDGDVVCFGFPFAYTIVNTPAQPVGITTPNGNYLHTASVEGIADGVSNCSFGAADGLCISADNTFSRMSADVSTVGYSDVQFKFWWLCEGGSSYYGQVYYSTNGGVNWTATSAPSQYNFQGSWTEQTLSLPAFGNQATLRFGFRFVNAVGTGALDPGFGIDDVRVIAATAVPTSISTNTIAPTAYCQGASLSVPFTAVGAYNALNTFSAELSDASGSFAAPVVIGTLNGTVSGTISCTIPALTPVGSGYRVRVVSSDPVTIGAANAVDISVTSAPFAGADDQVSLCKNSGTYDLFQFLPGASNCGGWTGPSGGSFSGQLNTSTDLGGVYTYTTNCAGGCPQDAALLTVVLVNAANAGNNVTEALCDSDAPFTMISFVDGGDLTGIFFYNDLPTSGSQLAAAGTYPMDYVVFGTTPCVNDTASFTFTVNAAADAGTSTSATICHNVPPPVQLIDLLAGSPQSGGSWTDPSGGPSDGTLEPSSDPAGLYTYTVTGIPPCGDDQAFVAVVIEICEGITEGQAPANGLQWLGQVGTQHLFVVGNGIAKGFEFLDASGRVALRVNGPFVPGQQHVDVGAIAPGPYLVRVVGSNTAVRMLHSTH